MVGSYSFGHLYSVKWITLQKDKNTVTHLSIHFKSIKVTPTLIFSELFSDSYSYLHVKSRFINRVMCYIKNIDPRRWLRKMFLNKRGTKRYKNMIWVLWFWCSDLDPKRYCLNSSIFWPAFGCCAIQILVLICQFAPFCM